MKENSPILSLCIPTNGAVAWVLPVIESIYSQGIDLSLFEVIITDNGKGDGLANAMDRFDYSNLHYFRTESEGFLNQIDAFEKSTGIYCKMLNHRSEMLPGSLDKLISLVLAYQEEKPIIYCAEGTTKSKDILIECDSLNHFIGELSFFVSWSVGVGVWQSDLVGIQKKRVDTMFPHTYFLFELGEKRRYVIWNEKYERMTDDSGKGGYNLFYTFSVSFLDLINHLRVEHRISDRTFVETKKDLFGFLKSLYLTEVILPSRHKFIIEGVRESLCVYYGEKTYVWMILGAWANLPVYFARKIFFFLKIAMKKTGRTLLLIENESFTKNTL